MTRRVRRLIFIFFLLVFIIAVPMIILYALGYGFDTTHKTLIVSNGGMYLKSIPTKAEIYIDGKSEGKTNGFVSHLSPQVYNVKIIKDGYQVWEKNLDIKPGLVELADNILLLPVNPRISLTTQAEIKWYTLLPNKREILYFATGSFYLLNLADNSEKKPIISLPKNFSPQNFIWSSDNVNFVMQQENQYYLANINNPNMFTDINALIKRLSKNVISKIENLNFDSAGNKIYFLSNYNLYALNLNNLNPVNSTLSTILLTNTLNYAMYDSGILYLDNSMGKINLFDPSTKQIQVFVDEMMSSFSSGRWIISPDNKKLSCQKESEVEILWLEDEDGQITRLKGETEKIDFGEKISEIIWYPETDEHLFISTTNAILVAELDNRQPQNIVKYIITDNAQIIYNQSNELLYFLSKNKLYQTEI